MLLHSVQIYHQISTPKFAKYHGQFNMENPISKIRWKSHKWGEIKCCKPRGGNVRRKEKEKNYYELLGVSVDSDTKQIKDAYRSLQKKYHPDIAGLEGHEYTLKMNEAYRVLMTEDLRREYDASIGEINVMGFARINYCVKGFSSWNGPLRPRALFVDENACIGCRECVHHASKTFVMDEAGGSARVKVQYGDDDPEIEISVDSCPVNCIHWVDREELEVLEFLIQPRLKQGYGVFGQGWHRPTNVFMEAKSFIKQLKRQVQRQPTNVNVKVEEETPAQAEARENASMKIKMERFSSIWDSVRELFGSNVWNRK